MSHRRPALTATLSALGAAALAVVGLAVPASAATTTQWASWSSSSPTSYSVQVANSPAMTATVTTDSRQGQIGVVSGTSTWLSSGTPVGAKYGSSQGNPYLNLRPKADTPTAPSTTTYAFAQPTPASGWTFVLGDIDADQVQISALGANGAPLTAAQLGFRGGFNYCAPGLPSKPSCTGAATDIPTWNAASRTLTGNAAATDTSGSSAWFEPDTPLVSLTFVFTQRSGFPVYQTWFASLARDITGTVTADTGAPGGATFTLRDADGAVVATTTSAPDGSYSFAGIQATSGYTVWVTPPPGMIAVGPNAQNVDLTTADGVADFHIRDIVPVAVSGTVRDQAGDPVAGATVELAPGITTTTGLDGGYLFDTAAVGSYSVQVTTVPDGYTNDSVPVPVSIALGDTAPKTGVDFVVHTNPTLSGRVTDAAGGVGGVVVTAAGPSGTLTAVTAADGTYTIPRLPGGAYTVSITAPTGYTIDGPASRSETVASADVTGVDFALAKEGAVAGTVTGPSGPVEGATITLTGPGGVTALATDPSGTYSLADLPAGTYTILVTAPTGLQVSGAASRTVTITAAGEIVTGQDFVLVAAASGTGGAAPTGGTTVAITTDVLADTGSDTGAAEWMASAAAAFVALGAAAVTLSPRRRVRPAMPSR